MPADPVETRQDLDELNLRMTEDLVTLYRGATGLSSPEFRALMIEGVPEVVDPYLALAADVAAVSYEQALPASDYRAITADPIPKERIAASTSWALQAVGESALSLLSGSTQRALFDAHRETTLANVRNERGARWARYASSTACAFCRMLATRGAVYTSEAAAGKVVGRGKDMTLQERRMRASGLDRGARGRFIAGGSGKTRGNQSLGGRYHDNCRCLAVPVRPGETYQPPAYVEQWEADYVNAVRSTDGAGPYGAIDTKAVLAHMGATERARRAVTTAPRPATKPGPGGTKPPIKPPTGGQSVQGRGDDREHKQLQKALDKIMRERIRQDIPLTEVQQALEALQAYRAAHGITGLLDSRVGPGFDKDEMMVVQQLLDEGRNVTSIPKKKSGAKTPDMAVDGALAEIKTSTGGGLLAFLTRLEEGAEQAPRIFVNASVTKIPVEKLVEGVRGLVDDGVLAYARVVGGGVDREFGRW